MSQVEKFLALAKRKSDHKVDKLTNLALKILRVMMSDLNAPEEHKFVEDLMERLKKLGGETWDLDLDKLQTPPNCDSTPNPNQSHTPYMKKRWWWL